jgi:hypothetical protein
MKNGLKIFDADSLVPGVEHDCGRDGEKRERA